MTFCEKLKLIRKMSDLTQAEFAKTLGISRGNLSGIELGRIKPTQLVINCVALAYNIDRKWLMDDANEDLNALNGSVNMIALLMDKYNQLDDKYKKFVENQIEALVKLQNTP